MWDSSNKSTPNDPTQCFTSRVTDYVRYRPGYPTALLDVLQQHCQLSPQTVIADVGSGTGKLTRLFLDHGNTVYGVEPNAAMRHTALQQLAAYSQFHSQSGRAEATGLPTASVSMVVAGQAFHWFDPIKTRQEFQRILLPQGWVVLVWNNRDLTDAFQQAYEGLLREQAPDYGNVRHRRRIALEHIQQFYGPYIPQSITLTYRQPLDWTGLWGRLMSCSYAPPANHPNHRPLHDALAETFEAHQQQGVIQFVYQTQVYFGLLPDLTPG
ncbi:MAG: class I SAM-dependent methyltransferase [Cyanobacteria bacterium J06632_22]